MRGEERRGEERGERREEGTTTFKLEKKDKNSIFPRLADIVQFSPSPRSDQAELLDIAACWLSPSLPLSPSNTEWLRLAFLREKIGKMWSVVIIMTKPLTSGPL